jgi:hypothetical protein
VSDPVLGGGLWLWYVPAFRAVAADVMAADAAAVGAVGVIVHEVGAVASTLRWLAAPANARALAGLETAIAIGSMGKDPWERHLADPMIAALRAGYRVIPDAEGAWDKPGGRRSAELLVAKVLDPARGYGSAALGRVADCAWRKPSVHPGFPIREFGVLCRTRYPQCYDDVIDGLQPDGGCARLLAGARAEYAARGTPADCVFATVRGYARSARDACKFALAEPHQLLYMGSRPDRPNEPTPQVRAGLLAAKRVRDAGGVVAWQQAHGLAADGLVGPKTLASLGL